MENTTEEPGHGSSPAAWTGVVIALIGVAIGTLFLYLDVIPLVWVGGAIIPIGFLIGFVLSKVGFGVSAQQAQDTAQRAARSR